MISHVEEVKGYVGRALTSGRLRLRPVRAAELDRLEQWWNEPELLPLQTGALLPRPAGGHIETFRDWYANTSASAVGLGIERIEQDDLLGAAVLYGATFGMPAATFAIQLRPDMTGRGYGTEATRLMVDYGFSTLPLRRIELRVQAFNDRARKCYRKAGFVEEGVRRQVTFADGQWHDEILMGIIRPDWERRTPAAAARTR